MQCVKNDEKAPSFFPLLFRPANTSCCMFLLFCPSHICVVGDEACTLTPPRLTTRDESVSAVCNQKSCILIPCSCHVELPLLLLVRSSLTLSLPLAVLPLVHDPPALLPPLFQPPFLTPPRPHRRHSVGCYTGMSSLIS